MNTFITPHARRLALAVTLIGVAHLAIVGDMHAAPRKGGQQMVCIDRSSGLVSSRRICRFHEERLSTAAIIQLAALAQPHSVGPQGPRGADGAIGASGPQGLQGVAGETGATGPAGPPGAQGLSGARGDTGVQGVQGAQGIPGAIGPQGPAGPQGERGASAFDIMPSSTSIFGAIGLDSHSPQAGADFGSAATVHAISPISLTNLSIIVKLNQKTASACHSGSCVADEDLQYQYLCPGSAESPAALPGALCIYATAAKNARDIKGTILPGGNGSHGIFLSWIAEQAGDTTVRAVWAYTAL